MMRSLAAKVAMGNLTIQSGVLQGCQVVVCAAYSGFNICASVLPMLANYRILLLGNKCTSVDEAGNY